MRVSDWIRGFFRPLNAAKSSFDFGPYSRDIYGCCLGKLQAADIDQEVKERAIGCMGQIVATLGDLLKSNLPGRTNELKKICFDEFNDARLDDLFERKRMVNGHFGFINLIGVYDLSKHTFYRPIFGKWTKWICRNLEFFA